MQSPPEEMYAIHVYGIELQRRAWEIVSRGQHDEEITVNVSYILVEGSRADSDGAQAKESSVSSSSRTSLFQLAPSENLGNCR